MNKVKSQKNALIVNKIIKILNGERKNMILEKDKNFADDCKFLREILWKEKYIDSGENVMIPTNAFISILDKKKRRVEQLDEFGYLLEDLTEDEYIDIED